MKTQFLDYGYNPTNFGFRKNWMKIGKNYRIWSFSTSYGTCLRKSRAKRGAY